MARPNDNDISGNETGIAGSDTDDLARMIRAAGRRPEPPQADRDAVYRAARAAWQAKLHARERRRLLYALAASVLVAITATLLWPLGSGEPQPVATARLVVGDVAIFSIANGQWSPLTAADNVRAGDRIRTGSGGRTELELLPGSSLRLAERTELEIGAAHALRLLSGKTYLDTGRDTGRDPHAIELATAFGTLRDIGTQFEANVTDVMLRLRVRTGRVELTPIDGPTEQTRAEEQIELTREGRVARASFPSAHPEWSWAEDLAVVPLRRGEPYSVYLEWIAAETGRRLIFADESVRILAETRRLDGDPSGSTPGELLQILDATEAVLAIDISDARTIRVTRGSRR